jgi:hypothetical protein
MAPDLADIAHMLRFQTAWERRFADYCLLLDAGLSQSEAERIASEVARDRAAEETRELAA